MNKISFLIVEDDEDIRELLQLVLKSNFNCEVDVAKDGREGLGKLEERDYSLCITDNQMPYLKGRDLIHQAQKKSLNTSFIMFSGDIGLNIQSKNLFRIVSKTSVHKLHSGIKDFFKTAN